MANTYTWAIAYMDTKPSDGGLTDVVISCQWTCAATTGGDNPTSASNYGYAHFGPPSTQDFTAYPDLTQNQVLGWVWASGVDKDATEAAVQQQIDNAINPPVVTLAPPWSA